MTTYRGDIRATALLALGAAPRFSAMTAISAWAQSIDTETLPVYGVATPRETADRSTHGGSERHITLVVAVKRRGHDTIEDDLDDDAIAAERAVLAGLRTLQRDVEMKETAVTINGEGEQRIGSLTLTFDVTLWLDDPTII